MFIPYEHFSFAYALPLTWHPIIAVGGRLPVAVLFIAYVCHHFLQHQSLML